MPELPEVEAIARTLRPLVDRRRILACRVIHRIAVARRPADHSGEAAARKLAGASGARVLGVERRGKYLLLRLDRGWLAFHLRLSGLMVWYDRNRPPEHVDVALDFASGTLGFVDRRHLGRVRWLDQMEELPGIARMGVDPLSPEFTPERLRTILRATRRPLKLVLMDQEKIAGLGNIWSCESLWLARLDPRCRADRIGEPATRRLAAAIVAVLRRALQSCLDPAPNFRDPNWWFQGADKSLKVYDREGRRCRRCGTPIRRIRQGGRSTYFCPGCQRNG